MIRFNLPPRSLWFDRLSLYRYVALLLFPLFVHSLVRAVTEDYAFTWRVVVFWIAVVLYYTAIIRDVWLMLRVRRQIHKSMNEAIKDSDSIR